MSASESTYHLALRDIHSAAGAAFERRHGWSLPAQYSDVAAEYRALREGAGIFDRSHRSRFMVTGTDALELLRASFEAHIEDLEEGRAMRAVRLDETGTIRDLVLVARTGGIAYLVVGEPDQRAETFECLLAAKGGDWDVRVEDRTETTCLLSVSGPRAAEVVEHHMSDALPARLPTLACAAFEFHGFRALATRTSDTGDDGFEFVLAPAVAQHVIETLRGVGVPLVGDDAHEIARVEACIPAFTPDLEPGLTPAQADLDVLLDIPGGDATRILAGVLLETDAAVPTGTMVNAESTAAGQVRSCVRSPGLNATIALALVDARRALPGTAIDAAGIRGTIVSKPFYRRRT